MFNFWDIIGRKSSCQRRTHSLLRPSDKTSCSYHLRDAEAVLEVVEGDAVVVAVDLKQEVLQDVHLDVERRQEVQVGEHHLEEHQHLRLLPLPVNNAARRCGRSQCV